MKRAANVAIMALLFLVGCTMPQENLFDQSAVGLPDVAPSQSFDIPPGGAFALEAKIVQKEINGDNVRVFGYNGQIPGPVLNVKQGSTITVNFKNALDMPTTVHWHGLRLDNRNDGVPQVTQEPVSPGGTFVYELKFPDAGVFWYHPHMREDVQQELGLYGAILVEPTRQDYYNPVDREEVIFLDDIRLLDGRPEPFFADKAYYALMGRFGNQMLTNGMTNYSLDVNAGDIVRFYFIDSANARVFNVSIEGVPLKVVGGDSGLYEQEFFTDSVRLAVSERAIVEALFDKPGQYKLMHVSPEKTYELGIINVAGEERSRPAFSELKNNSLIVEDVKKLRNYFNATPDFEIDLTIEMPGMGEMKSVDVQGRIEWEDDMVMMNAMATSENTKWILRDKKTGKENMDIKYRVRVGDVKKVRFFNDPKSAHPMQHPMHIHGQRFLVLSEDGKPNTNLVWKDTVLVPTSSTVDILVDFTNPGTWMFHCHIAEHLETGMMGLFEVTA